MPYWIAFIYLASSVYKALGLECSLVLNEPIISSAYIVDSFKFTVKLANLPAQVSASEILVTRLSGVDLGQPLLVRTDSYGGVAIFDSTGVGGLEPGEACLYYIRALDETGIPLCETPLIEYIVPSADCTTGLVFSRPDSVSLTAKMVTAPSRPGVCRVYLKGYASYDIESPGILEERSCLDDFVIESDRKLIALQTGATASLSYAFVSAEGSPSCESSEYALTIMEPSCDQSLEVTGVSASMVAVGISNPRPLEGHCALRVLSCEGSAPLQSAVMIPMPSCRRPVDLSFDMLLAYVPELIPGKTCSLSWRYQFQHSQCMWSGSLVTPPLRSACSLSLTSSASGSITLSPSVVYPVPGGKCTISLISCDHESLPIPVETDFTSCDPSSTLTFTSAVSDILKQDSTCMFRLRNIGSDEDVGCDSGLLSFSASTVPGWDPVEGRITRSLLAGEASSADCLEILWDLVDNTGGSPVLCYMVWRKDGDERWYLMQDCSQSSPGSRRFVSCGYDKQIYVQFKVHALNRNGLSVNPILSGLFMIDDLLVSPGARVVDPHPPGPYMSGSFPLIRVQGVDSVQYRTFVLQMFKEGKFFSSRTFVDDVNIPGNYVVEPPSFVPVGEYSLMVSSLEQGGLQAQYWNNIFFSGDIDQSRKSRFIRHDKSEDLVSVRWTGFLKPAFSERYTFSALTEQYIAVWIQGELVLDKRESRCVKSCSFSIELEDGELYSIRIDYYVSRGFGQKPDPSLRFHWESYSQVREEISPKRLFKSVEVENGNNRSLSVIPDLLSAQHTLVLSPIEHIVAGVDFEIHVLARDRFDQNRTGSADAFMCVLSAESASYTALSIPLPQDGLHLVPLRVTTAGTYRITVATLSGDLVTDSSDKRVLVIPADAVEVVASSVVIEPPVVKYVNQSVSVSAVLRDMYGNTIDGSVAEPELFLSIEWLYDRLSLERLANNDNVNRTRTFGKVFVNRNKTLWNTELKVFKTWIETPLSGTYHKIELSVRDHSPISLDDWEVLPSSQVHPPYSVLLSSVPDSIVAGETIELYVQLRDSSGNCISDTPEELWRSGAVRIAFTDGTGTSVESTCQAVPGLNGKFLCEITLTRATVGSLSVRINGEEAWYIPDQSAGPKPDLRGPWTVRVDPNSLDASKTLVMGLLPSYKVSHVPNGSVRLVFRDSFSNLIPSFKGFKPDVIIKFLKSDASLAFTVDPLTYEYNEDLTASFNSETSSDPSPGWTLEVLVDGVSVPIVSPLVQFKIEGPSGLTSTCSVGGVQTAGASFTITCIIKDRYGNSLDGVSGLLLESRLSLQGAGTGPVTTESLSLYPQTGEYVSSSDLKIAGSYSAEVTLGVPGGLLARYYGDSSFSNLIVFDAPGYSKIEAVLERDWQGSMTIHSIPALSAEWSGWLVPPATLTVRFYLKALGGIRVQIGQAVHVDTLSSPDSLQVTFDTTFISTHPVELSIQYIPLSMALVSLTWEYPSLTGNGGFSIASSVLLAPVPIQIQPDTVTLLSGRVSSASIITTPSFPLIRNAAEHFLIYPLDEFGNAVISPISCMAPGTFPSCLFDIYMEAPDGSPAPVVTNESDGSFRVDMVFISPGPVRIRALLVTGPNPSDRVELTGSPISAVVYIS